MVPRSVREMRRPVRDPVQVRRGMGWDGVRRDLRSEGLVVCVGHAHMEVRLDCVKGIADQEKRSIDRILLVAMALRIVSLDEPHRAICNALTLTEMIREEEDRRRGVEP
jgi:hypothetical protein